MHKIIPLRQAVIHSDFESRVRIAPLGQSVPGRLSWSVGACHGDWGEATAEDLHLGLYRAFSELVEHAGIPVQEVHRAFCAIPEYRAGLSPDHRDAMGACERQRLSLMLDLPRRTFLTSLFSA